MLTHQFTCERYPTAEGWTVLQTGGANLSVVDGSLAGIGSKCLKLSHATVSSRGYFYKRVAINPGEWFYVSFYTTFIGDGPSVHYRFDIGTDIAYGGNLVSCQNYCSTAHPNGWNVYKFDDNTNIPTTLINDNSVTYGNLCHFAIGIKRATTSVANNGELVYIKNGVTRASATGIDNYHRAAQPYVRFGETQGSVTYAEDVRFDDIRFGTRLIDVLPSSVTPPAPTGELPQAARTIVLFNQNNTDSRTFAESIVADGSLLCPLPCSTTETLANYATFVNEVEHPLKNFLAFQPIVAAQITCIIAGLNVPGFFIDNGVQVSTASRLADIDSAFVAGKLNTLYGTDARLTKTMLNAAGVRLAARIDANALAYCQSLKTLGETQIDVNENEKFYTNPMPSLDEQLLRLPFEPIENNDEISNIALVYYSQAVEELIIGEAGEDTRLTFIDSVTASHNREHISQYLLYGFRSIISAGDNFDISAFCRMLRSGGTIVEAFTVASAKLDFISQLAAWPFLTAKFPKSGYNAYFGEGSRVNIDYSQIYAALPTSSADFEMIIPHKPNSVHAMCIRKISPDGLEETRGRIMMLEADSSGLLHMQLPAPYDLTAREAGENNIELSFSCIVHEGQSQPFQFEIMVDNGSGEINRTTPIAVIPFNQGEREYAVIVEAASRPAKFTVRARSGTYTGDEATPVSILPLRIPVRPEVLI